MTWMQTFSGRAFDLLRPSPDMVAFGDIAHALARIPRFLGHTYGPPYSVAQHCALGADLLISEGASVEAAVCFLLHDAHEAYIGDITTPVKQALAALWDPNGERDLFAGLRGRIDAAIHATLGTGPAAARNAALIAHTDLRLLKLERDSFMGEPPLPWHASVEEAEPVRLVGLVPWTVAEAEQGWLSRLEGWLPGVLAREAA